jgi:hypothetical protein
MHALVSGLEWECIEFEHPEHPEHLEHPEGTLTSKNFLCKRDRCFDYQNTHLLFSAMFTMCQKRKVIIPVLNVW